MFYLVEQTAKADVTKPRPIQLGQEACDADNRVNFHI